MERVLVVDDDAELCQLVTRFLAREGFDMRWAPNGAAGVELALAESYSLIMLDVMLPDTDGFDVLRRIRRHSGTPVLMLTARGDTHDRIRGLEMGADDYLPKPFDPAELVARIRAILRRSSPQRLVSAICVGDVELDGGARTVQRSGAPVDLTRKEFGVLEVLLAAGGAVVSSEELLERVWDENADPFTTTVRVTVMTLRKKLGEPGIIETVVGSGYRVPSAGLASG